MAKEHEPKKRKKTLDRFEPGGDLGPVEDRTEFERCLYTLPAGEKELAQESARFADLCRHFAQEKMDIPADIIEQLNRISRLGIAERVEAMKKLNKKLMEYLSDVGQDHGIRH